MSILVECWKMEEHRVSVTDPNVVEAGGSAQCDTEIQPIISNRN